MEVLKQIYPIAKKIHRCDWCGQSISVGEKYEYCAAKYDGDFFIWKNHLSCRELTKKLNMWDDCCDEGLGDEEFQEYVDQKYYEITKDDEYSIPWKYRLLIVKSEVL